MEAITPLQFVLILPIAIIVGVIGGIVAYLIAIRKMNEGLHNRLGKGNNESVED